MSEADVDDDLAVLPPRANPELQGHEEAERTLLEAYSTGQLAHAFLITGPHGIGKATLAYRFARFLLAQPAGGDGGGLFGDGPPKPTSLRIDPGSPIFRRIAASGHAGLLAIERRTNEKTGKLASEIVVDDVRAIGPFFGMTAAEGGWRVVIVDSADDLNRSAANAVLKVLEEPPERSILLLTSANPGRLLPTIRSRCRKLALRPLSDRLLTEMLRRQRPELDTTDAGLLATLAEGSLGRALALADEEGLKLHSDIEAMFKALPRLDVPALHGLADRLSRPGKEESFDTAMALVERRLASLLRCRAEGQAGKGEPAWVAPLAGSASLDRWLEVWEKVTRLVARTDSANLDRKQVVLNVFLALEQSLR